jgi:hypothetical protein
MLHALVRAGDAEGIKNLHASLSAANGGLVMGRPPFLSLLVSAMLQL